MDHNICQKLKHMTVRCFSVMRCFNASVYLPFCKGIRNGEGEKSKVINKIRHQKTILLFINKSFFFIWNCCKNFLVITMTTLLFRSASCELSDDYLCLNAEHFLWDRLSSVVCGRSLSYGPMALIRSLSYSLNATLDWTINISLLLF